MASSAAPTMTGIVSVSVPHILAISTFCPLLWGCPIFFSTGKDTFFFFLISQEKCRLRTDPSEEGVWGSVWIRRKPNRGPIPTKTPERVAIAWLI